MWTPEHHRGANRNGLRYPSDLSGDEWVTCRTDHPAGAISAVPQPPAVTRIILERRTRFCGALRSRDDCLKPTAVFSRDGHNNSCSNDESLNGFGRLGGLNESDQHGGAQLGHLGEARVYLLVEPGAHVLGVMESAMK